MPTDAMPTDALPADTAQAAAAPPPFDYRGEPAWREPITAALRAVVDPELGLSIVELGLVYGVEARPDRVTVRLTMTSAACPVADLILGEVTAALDDCLPAEVAIAPQLVWAPPWTPDRLSAAARRQLRW